MKIADVKDELARCRRHITTVVMALENTDYFPNGTLVADILNEVQDRITNCINGLEQTDE